MTGSPQCGCGCSAATPAWPCWCGMACGRHPCPRAAGPDEENGRGLSIVEALSGQWDFYFPDLPFTVKVTRAFITQA